MLPALDKHPATGMHCAAEPCLFVRLNLCHVFLLPKIEQCEDEDPHQVDEMPVQAHDLHGLVMRHPAGEEARTRAIVVSPPDLSCSSDEEDHAEGHVGSMKARDSEKGRAKLASTKRVSPGAYRSEEHTSELQSLRRI